MLGLSLRKSWLIVTYLSMLFAVRAIADDVLFMGEYEGIYKPDKISTLKASAKVVAEGPGLHVESPGHYRVVLKALPNRPDEEGIAIEVYGVEMDNEVVMFGRSFGRLWRGSIKDGKLVLKGDYYGMAFELKKIVRKSPTLGLKPPKTAIVLLPYEPGKAPDTSAWTNQSWKALKDGSMEVGHKTTETKRKFGDIKLHLEFMLPLERMHFDQYRVNSGIFLNGSYEIQVLDSFGLVPSSGDCGAVYGVARPRVNACLPPLAWQTYDITFLAPRMNPDGSIAKLPRVTVVHNGITICEDVEIPAPNLASGRTEHISKGPLGLQDAWQLLDYGRPVRYRNIWLVELAEKDQD